MKKLVLITLASLWLFPAQTRAADAQAGQEKSAPCAACHGVDGNSVNPQWPKLAGQHPEYIYKQLQDFKSKARANAIMNAQAADLSAQDMRDLAAYFAKQTTTPAAAQSDKLKVGQEIYRAGVAARDVPACMACHDPGGAGNAAAVFPKLSYQHAQYVAAQLRAYHAGERANDPAGMMRDIAGRMTVAEIDAVAQYIAGLHRVRAVPRY
ncbi:MAG: c-type cytochrome [Gammaproteobacteria bacterium]|nr:cytochrome c4 [Gammaproteobacteria bacterium]MBA3731322.1 cytochrome c4 [Gammaproteobacteria bacterium]